MITGITHLHSVLRWVAIVLMIATMIDSLVRMYKPFNDKDRKLALFAMITMHIQLLLGLALYIPFVTRVLSEGQLIMKNPFNRFYIVEHLLGMVLAITIITIGYMRSKRQSEQWAKHRMIFFYYLIGFLVILASIPWPFRDVVGRGWI
ncbi:MAG: cytochrome b [Crocinitomicaceae bacterium]|nr:cytochrome b [Crocinitomicaceae bacterium]